MPPVLSRYATLVFDCDGVVLDSNRTKTEAFRTAALPYGPDAADALVAHHIAHGGVSRYAKFAHFLAQIVPAHATVSDGPGLDALLDSYSQATRIGLINCVAAEGLEALRTATMGMRWLIVSGGDQAELRRIFAVRGLAGLFDGGIFGSPDTKDEILAREIAAGTIQKPALFMGDSRYDHAAAKLAGLDFVFINGWTEVHDWPDFVACANLATVAGVADLLSPTLVMGTA